jgi:hypothetical protein
MADLQSLAADLKETQRLLKILDEFATEINKNLSADIIKNKNELQALAKRVAELEKKQKK